MKSDENITSFVGIVNFLLFNLFAGAVTRDVSFILHVTLCLLRMSDESESLSCWSHVSTALPVSGLHAKTTEGVTLPVGCSIHEEHAEVPSSARWCRPG